MFSQLANIMLQALLLLLFLKTSESGVTLEKICVKSAEMVALECLVQKSTVTWSTPPSSDRKDFLISERSLVVLRASESHQGKYSCARNKTFELTVYTTLPSDCKNKTLYSQICELGNSCTLNCPKINTPKPSTNITSKDVTWQKDDRYTVEYFSSVTESNQGDYSCIRSFVYNGAIYNKTFSVKLVVTPQKRIKNENIISPLPDKVFDVVVGSPRVINCKAVLFSDMDEVYWHIENNPVSISDTSRIYYNSSLSNGTFAEGRIMTASLVFKMVSEEDLSRVFTCKLESVSQNSKAVNITLAKKARPSYVAVTTIAVVVPVVLVVLVLTSIKYKIHITLFLRDTLGCHYRVSSRVSDGKNFDACIMYYTSEEAGLCEDDMRTLQNLLEDHFGYSLCLFDRNVLPGKAIADAVLDCVEQSRAVLLVPASPALHIESALLSAIHEALVERQTRLVFIRDRSTETTGARPVPPETLQLLTDLGRCVTWRGSFDKSSFFWKQLRYYLPPVQQHHKISLIPQTV